MKIFNKLLIVFALTFTFSSCENFIGGDINADPNNPVTVPVPAQMPAFQIALADEYGGMFSRLNCMLSQQVEGVERQWASMNQYTGLTPNRFDASWTNIYENTLNEIKIATTSATADGNNHYVGVLNVIEAFTAMAATDVWDDMPYSDALKGIESQNPAYDAQSAIYSSVYGLLDKASSAFAGAPGAVVPGAEDVYYGGDIALWTKAAQAIRARGLLKQGDYAGAMSAAAASFASAAENMSYAYPDANSASPWYRFNRDRTGDIEFHPQMRAMMQGLVDTNRLNVMDQIFITDHTYLTANFLQELITYREMQFIIAECDFRNNGGTQAGYDAYLAGIKASFDRLGLGDGMYQEYLMQPGIDPGAGNLSLENIMTQKYIAMFLQPETYSDWRRTDIPSLTPVSGTAVPVRWHYSSNEYLFNSNSPSEGDVNIFTNKVGWDN